MVIFLATGSSGDSECGKPITAGSLSGPGFRILPCTLVGSRANRLGAYHLAPQLLHLFMHSPVSLDWRPTSEGVQYNLRPTDLASRNALIGEMQSGCVDSAALHFGSSQCRGAPICDLAVH